MRGSEGKSRGGGGGDYEGRGVRGGGGGREPVPSPIAINSASLTFPRHPLQHTPSFPLTIPPPPPPPIPSPPLHTPPPPSPSPLFISTRRDSHTEPSKSDCCHIVLHNVCRHHIHLPNALPTCTRNAHCYNTYFSLFMTIIYYCYYYYIFQYPLLPLFKPHSSAEEIEPPGTLSVQWEGRLVDVKFWFCCSLDGQKDPGGEMLSIHWTCALELPSALSVRHSSSRLSSSKSKVKTHLFFSAY